VVLERRRVMAARLRPEGGTQGAVTPEQVQQTLERILASKYFLHAPMKRKFLRLVCEYYLNGRAGQLNEYLIGREVFERDGSYNPAADPIVRVGAHDLRKKLRLYYEGEGATDDIRLEIPIGGYEPEFVRLKQPPAETAASPQPALVRPPFIRRAMFNKPMTALGLAIFVLSGAVAVLWSANRELRRQVAGSTPKIDEQAYGVVWQPFFKGGQTLVVLSNPTAYRLSDGIDAHASAESSLGLTERQAADLARIRNDGSMGRLKRPLRLVLSDGDYTGIGEAVSLYRITDFFRSAGRSVLPVQRRIAIPKELNSHNLILLGSALANESASDLAVREDFHFSSSSTIENRLPLSSEATEYRPEFDRATGRLLVDYALITVRPNLSFAETIMVLAGIHGEGTEAAAQFVTTKERVDELNQRLEQLAEGSTPPKYYQALLKVGVENGTPAATSVIALHELRVRQE
jgi:hypothetical protein